MSIIFPHSSMPLYARMFICHLRSYPYLQMAGSVRISLKSSWLPLDVMHSSAPAPATATVILLMPQKNPSCSLSVYMAQPPVSLALLIRAAGETSLILIVFFSLGDVGCTFPMNLRSEPNSYFSKRSATSGL